MEEGVSGGRLGELYVRHGPAAVRLAYLLTGDRELAQDLVQDAFARLAGRFVDLRAPEAFDAYLRRMVVNLVKMHFRRRRVERAYLERAEREHEEQAEDRDVAEYEAMRRALLALPVRQRTALVLRFYEDLPEGQIAGLLGCRPATVRSLVHRGLQKLGGSQQAELRED